MRDSRESGDSRGATVTQLRSSSRPPSDTPSPPPHSAGACVWTLLASAIVSGIVVLGILRILPALIEAKAWWHFLAALGALLVVGAPASALPLLNRIADRFIGGQK